MKFYKKLTLSLFLLSFGIITTLCIAVYFYLSQYIRSEMVKQSQSELDQLTDTFLQLEEITEIVGINALNSLKEIEKISGFPSNQQLKDFARETSISHIYIANSSGNFIRSTNGPIKANIFSYCKDYVNLTNGKADVFVTPVVPSSDEPTLGFYKYIMIPNVNKNKILEASISFDFIGKFLKSSLKNNQNILSVSLYTPTGLLLGSISRENIHKNQSMSIVKSFRDNSKNCCECKVKNLTDKASTNDYYYKIVASFSTKKMTETINYLVFGLFIFFTSSIFICIFLSRLLSNLLTNRLNKLHEKINQLINDKHEALNLKIDGKDEISDLADQFNKLLITLNDNKRKLLLAEKDKILANLSAQLAHDIRSPLTALDVIVKDIKNIPEEQRIIIRNSVSRINDIANNLLTQYRERKNEGLYHNASNNNQ